jgi:deoxyribose-phosphate aldolase
VTKKELSSRLEHSRLRPQQSKEVILASCREAVEMGCRSLYVLPCNVKLAVDALKGTGVLVATVVGFPLGVTYTEVKVLETKMVIEDGAQELDMVMNISAAMSGEWDVVEKDIRSVVQAAAGCPVKVILETHYLSDEQVIKACEVSTKARAAYVKTSTGFTETGATLHHIALMRRYAGKDVKVKAAGGVAFFEDAVAVLNSGADSIGASRTAQILSSDITGTV